MTRSGVNFAPWHLHGRSLWVLAILLFMIGCLHDTHKRLEKRLYAIEQQTLLATQPAEKKSPGALSALFDVLHHLQETLPQGVSLASLNLDKRTTQIQGTTENLMSLQHWMGLNPLRHNMRLQTSFEPSSGVFEFKITVVRM